MPHDFITTPFSRTARKSNTKPLLVITAIWAAALVDGEEALAQCAADVASPPNIVCSESPDTVDDPDGFFTEDTVQSLTINAGVLVNDQDDPDKGNVGGVILIGDPVFPDAPLPEGTLPDGSVLGDVLINGTIEDTGEISNALRLAGAVDGDLIVNGMISGGITGVWAGFRSNGSEVVITGDFINNGSISGGNNAVQISTEFPGDISVGVGGDFINSGDIIGDADNDGIGDGVSDTLSTLTPTGGTSGTVEHGTVIGNFTNQQGATISGGNDAISLQRIDGNFTNAGDIIANPNDIRAFGIGLDLEELGGNFLNTATGSIDADFEGVNIEKVVGNVENVGMIDASRAFDIDEIEGSFTNKGTIIGDVLVDVIGNGFDNSGSITDTFQAVTFREISGGFVNSGSIESTGSSRNAIGTTGTGTINGDFVNEATGTISATDTAANLFSFVNGNVTNYGTITGDSDNSGGGEGLRVLRITGNFSNMADAQISGETGLELDDVEGQAINAGTITGNTAGDGDTDGVGVELRGEIAGGFFNQSGGEITGFIGVLEDSFSLIDDVVINAGTITGTGGIAIDLSTGNDVLEIRNGSVINGAVIGTETLRLGGDQSFTFDVSQVSTQIGDSVQYRGIQAIEVNGGGTFTLEESQTGIGTLDLNVVSGTALVNGDISTGNTTVTGGTLGGTGTVGDLDQTGGAVAPGNSIGTLMVDGNFTQGPDGVLQIEIGPTGSTDLIDISGTADVDGTLDITLFDPFVAPGDTFTFLIADGGVLDGDFATVTTPNGLDVTINVGANQIDIEIVSLVLGGCVQTGSNVLCQGIDIDGFENTVDSGLDVLVESDALVVNPGNPGLDLGDGATIDNQGTINNTTTAIRVGADSSISNVGSISAQLTGIDASMGGQIVNEATGTINANVNGVIIDGGADGTGKVTNHGNITVTGGISIGLFMSGGATAVNNGVIESSSTGIFDLDGLGVTITNTGMISANGNGLEVRSDAVVNNNQSGTVTAGNSGIIASGSNIEINNAGSLISTNASGIRFFPGGPNSVNNSGTIMGTTFGIQNGDDITVTNEATGTIKAGSETMDVEGVGDAIRLGENANIINHGMISSTEGDAIQAASGQVTNSGTIIATQPPGTRFDSFDAIAFSGDGTVINEATGVITADDESIDIDGAGTVTNHGLINGNGSLLVRVRGDSTITNTGTIAQVDNNGDGIQTGSNTTIVNSGMILTGSESVRIDDFLLDDGDPYTGTLDNSGDILVDVDIADSEFAPASAIFISIDEGRTFAVDNSGTIESGVNAPDGTDTTGRNAFGLSGGTHLELINQAGGLVRGAEQAVFASGFSTASFSIENHGTITGRNGTAIEGAAQSDTVMNAGTINGDILLLGGNDSFTTDVGAGVENGVVNGGIGEDDLSLTGTGNFDLGRIGTDILAFNSLDIRDGADVTATGTNADVGLVTVDGTSSLTLAAGATLVAPLNLNVENGGTVGGNGTVQGNLINDGTVAPGESIGTLMVNGNFVQNIDGVLMIEIGPTGSTDLIAVTGLVDVDGKLDVSFSDPNVEVGDIFTFLTAGDDILDGSFDSFDGPEGASIAIIRNPNDLQIEILAVTIGGCIQTGSDVLCTGIDGDGFENTVDSGLDVLVEADAQVLHYTVGGRGLVLGDAAMVDNEGEIDVVASGIVAGDGSAVVNRADATINAGQGGVVAGNDSQVTNAGTINSGQLGIQAGTNATVVNSGAIAADLGSGVIIESGSVNNAEGGTISGDNVVLVTDGPGAVTNSGSIIGDNFRGVQLDAGGTVTNNEGATIEAEFAILVDGGIGTVSNAGMIHGTSIEGISLRAGGSVDNSGTIKADGSGDGVEISGAAGTVTNSGLIDAEDRGISLIAGGSVTNEVGGVIDGETGGVSSLQAATVINNGTIIDGGGAVEGAGVGTNGGDVTNNAGAIITGSANGVASGFGGPGTVTNSGTIEALGGAIPGAGPPSIVGRGVNFRAGGTVDNSGDISGATVGIESFGAATINNSGSISSFDSPTADGQGISIRGGAGSVTNSGEIISGSLDVAIRFDQFTPFDDTVELQPGSVVMGSLLGGPGTDALMLTGGADTNGVLDLDASPVIDFETYDKNGDGTWQVTGDATAMTGQFDVNAGTLNVDGNLENTSFDVMSGATLGGSGMVGDVTTQGTTSPGNSIGTLMIDGNFTQGSDGVLMIEIGPTGSNDLVDISGTADLDGTLDIILFDTDVQVGDSFTFLIADGGFIDDSFDTVGTPAGLDVQINTTANEIEVEIVGLALGACVQTGLDVLCEGIDGDGFANTVDTGLDVLVVSDAQVLNPDGNGLTLGEGNVTNVEGTINAASNGVDTGDENAVNTGAAATIIADGHGILVGHESEAENTGTITAGIDGINGGDFSNGFMVNSVVVADVDMDGDFGFINKGAITAGNNGITAGRGSLVINHEDATIVAGNNGIENDGDGEVLNRGSIDAAKNGIVVGDGVFSNLDNDDFTQGVTNSGTIIARDGSGIVAGDIADITNGQDFFGGFAGDITATEDGIRTGGNATVIQNFGLIDAGDDGIEVTGSFSTIRTSSDSSITAGDVGILTGAEALIDNKGSIEAATAGIQSGDESEILNSGTITGEGDGIVAGSGYNQDARFPSQGIINSGTIEVDGDGIQAGNNNIVQNLSDLTIDAGDDGMALGDGNDVLNTGTIEALDFGIYARSDNNVDLDGDGNFGITNEGTVDSQVDGIFAANNNIITNRGEIFARNSLANAPNDGDRNSILDTAATQQGTGIGVGSNNTVTNEEGATITAFDAGIATSLTTGTGNTITNRGAIDTVTLTSSEDFASDAGIRTGADNMVDNFGTILSRDIGISTGAGSTVTNHAGATITSQSRGIIVNNLNQPGGGTAINDGEINVGGAAFGVAGFVINDGVTATNNGTVTSDGDGFFVNSGEGSTLNNSGTLNVADDGFDLFNNSTINNNAGGEVNATGGANSNAIESFGTGNTINNSGDLISTGGIGIALLGFGPNTVNNNTGGVIEGAATAISGGGGDETVFNAGTINGDVLLAGGADIFRTNVTTGTVNSVIDGGDGTDALILQGTGTFELDEAINFESLSVQDGAAVTGTGSGNDVGTSAIDGTSSLTLAAESTLVTSGGLTIADGGALNGTGAVDGAVANSGTVAPGTSIGMLTVSGDFVMDADGVLEIEFGPTGTNDLLAVGGEVVLDGTLDIILVDQNIETGDVFTIITAADGVVGEFDIVNNVNEIGNFEIIITPNSVQIGVLFLEGCIQTGSDVLCTGTDPDGFTNVEDDALNTFVEPDAIVNNPDGNGLTLGDNGAVDNQGTIDVAGDGINIGSGNIIKNSSTETIIAGEDGIDAGDNNDITNTGAITAGQVGILAGFDNNMDLDEDGRAGIVNEGTIDAETGISVGDFNSITNAAGGEITVTDIGIFGVARNTIVNDGLIESDDDGIVVGVDIEGEGDFFILDGGNTVTNNGTIIAADDGIVAHSFDNTINNTSNLTITAGNDAVDITGEGNVLNNSGTLTGGDQTDGTGHGVDVTGDGNTINNTGGTIRSGDGHGISLDDNGNTVVNDAGGVIDTTGAETGVAGLDGINAAGQANTITNQGMIDAARNGIALESFNTATNAADGMINAADNGIFGVARNTIVNDGVIQSDDDGIVVGVDIEGEGDFFILDGGNTVTNNGTIIAMDDGIVAHSFDNTISNTSDLTITAGDDGVDITGEGNVFNNAGTVTGGTAGGASSHGVDITGDMNTVNNTGTIASLSAAAISATGNDILIDNAGGTITGGGMAPVAIQGGAGGQTVINRMEGLITGDVRLGAGDDTVELETGSTVAGAIDLGEDEGDTDTDLFVLSGEGEGVFDGELAGAELLDKVDSGRFDLNGTITVDGVLMTRAVDVDNDGDGIADQTVQVFDRVVGTTVAGGTLNIGGLILVDDDDDPATNPVLTPNTGATLVSPTVDVLPGARLGGHGTVVTDPSGLGGLFVSGAEADPLAPTGAQGVIAPGTSIGTLDVVGRVVFDSVQTAVINDVTLITNNGGRFEVDLNDTGGHDLLNVTAAGVATTDLGVPNDTTGPDGTPDGIADSIDVEAVPTGDGTATLGGTIDVVLDPEFLDADQDGTPDLDAEGNRIATADYTSQARIYDVLVAEGGVNSTFDTIAFDGGPNDGAVTVREDNPATADVDETNRAQLFKGSIDYLADRVRITSIPDFDLSAETSNQMATAEAIDGFTQYGLNEDPLHALAAQLGTSGDIPGALDDLHGEWFNAFDEVGINVSRTIMHQASLRSYEARGGRRDNNAVTINMTENSVTGASGQDNRASFWLAGTFDFVDVDSDNGFIEYEFDTVSGYGGIDYLIDNNILIGITGGFGSTDVDFAGRAGEGDVDSWQVAGYASIFGPEWFVELSGGVGGMDIESTRDITFGTVNLTALADYNGDLAYVGGRGGYQFNLGDGFQITPTVGLTYARVEQDRFTETGAAPVNLSIDATSFDSVRLEGVIRIAKTMRSGNGGWFTPYASIGVGHEFEDDLRPISGRFDGVPGSDFTVFGDVPRKTTALFGAGISAMIGTMLQLYFDYSGEIGGDYQDHAITGGAKIRF